jgi:hypothetical protein
MSVKNEDNLSGNQEPDTEHLDDTKLEGLRWQLQKEISGLKQERNRGTEFQLMKISYNRIVDALREQQKCPPCVDPMERLPHELILKILLDTSTLTYSWRDIREIRDLLQLTMVSKLWRNLLLSEPFLWSHIFLDNGYDSDAIIALQTRLSKPLTLTLDVRLPFERWDTLGQVLRENRERIETIIYHEIDLESFVIIADERKDPHLWAFLDKLGPLPSLRHIGDSYGSRKKSYNIQML